MRIIIAVLLILTTVVGLSLAERSVRDFTLDENPLKVMGKIADMIVFQDDVENGINGWSIEPREEDVPRLFHLSNRRYSSEETSWYYGKEDTGNYDTGSQPNAGSIVSPKIDLSNTTNTQVVFSHYLDTEDFYPYDLAKVLVARNKFFPQYVEVWHKTSTHGSWVTETVDASILDGSPNAVIVFSFNTMDDEANMFEGWYVDDIQVRGNMATPNILPVSIALPDGKVVDKDGDGWESVVLNGSLSYDRDGYIEKYMWWNNNNVFWSNMPEFSRNLSFGNYKVWLHVTDNRGATVTDIANFSVVDDVKIIRAVYRRSILTVTATTNNPNANLSVVGFGNMTKRLNGVWVLNKIMRYPGDINITVASTTGGSHTVRLGYTSRELELLYPEGELNVIS